VCSALSFIGGFLISARALHVLNLIWFGYIARPSPIVERRGIIFSFKLFLPALLQVEEVGGGSAPCGGIPL
jgi:hypothetical protein